MTRCIRTRSPAPGSDSFGYNAVGNQVARPDGVTVSYTPFDLPKAIAKGASVVKLDYDGDQQRIRKSTPDAETIYFDDLYERVTAVATGTREHRYYVHSPERVVAVVTRGGTAPGTRVVHVDHLGSVDALTDEQGKGEDPRSYDPFGARRNPVWGQPVPASFASLTTLGFTGHESDDELGLVNMKGRVFDPKVGRFLTTDPIVSAPLSGQSWNPYSYVGNNPLNYVDPSGFQEEPSAPPTEIYKVESGISADLHLYVIFYRRPREASPSQAAEVGAEVPPVDVGTTGSASGSVPQPVTTAPTDWSANPYVQVEGGFVAGAALGAVPFAGLGYTFLDEAKVLPPSTAEARRGLAVGQIFIGAALIVGGVTGEVFGGLMTVTGIGSLVGVPAIAVSAVLVTGGAANVLAGLHELMTTGSGSSATREGDPKIVDHPSQSAARRAAEREAGMGKHGARTDSKEVDLRPGSRSPEGPPGVRTEVTSTDTGRTVHHDPFGHKSDNIPPHYGVDTPGGTTHHTYPSTHDPQLNR